MNYNYGDPGPDWFVLVIVGLLAAAMLGAVLLGGLTCQG